MRLRFPAVATLLAMAVLVAASNAGQITRLRPPDVRYVPTPQNVVEAMLELAHVTSADVVYDLGSGDGRIPITAAKNTARAVSASRSTRSTTGTRSTTSPGPAWAIASGS